MMIAGFILSILTIVIILTGCVMPRYYDAFIPVGRRGEGTEPTAAMETKIELSGRPFSDTVNAEGGLKREGSSDNDEKRTK